MSPWESRVKINSLPLTFCKMVNGTGNEAGSHKILSPAFPF